jgi:hypothetical protein
MFIATGLVAWWAAAIALVWGILIGDINPDRMPPLTALQQTTVYDVTHPMMLAASVPPVLLSIAWAVTAGVLMARRRVCPDCETSAGKAGRGEGVGRG